MTRFARSKGSKSSNERIPEAATPWSEISQQLQQKSSSSCNTKTKAEFEAQRKANYEKFLKEEAIKKSQESWCEFPNQSPKADDKQTKIKKAKKEKNKPAHNFIPEQLNTEGDEVKPKGKEKKIKKKCKRVENKSDDEDNFDIDNPELSQWCDEHYDEETNLKYEQLTQQLEIVCKQNMKSKKKKNNTFNIVASSQDTEPENKITKRKKIDEVKEVLGPVSKKKKQPTDEEQYEKNASFSDRTDRKRKNKKKKHSKDVDEAGEKILSSGNIATDKTNSERKEKILSSGNIATDKTNSERKEKKSVVSQNFGKEQKFSRRKPLPEKNYVIINGEEVEIVNIQGFPVTSKDAERILQLRKLLISKGIPKSEVERTIKLERRKAEKSLGRLKKNLCFHCRKGGHILSECPEMNKNAEISAMPVSGLCFKCGSTEHTHFNCKVVRTQEYKFAQCFVCKEQGHISRQCPDNPKGIYPKGGACRVCGDVTHLRKDCPKVKQENDSKAIRLETLQSNNIEDIEAHTAPSNKVSTKQSIKHVRF